MNLVVYKVKHFYIALLIIILPSCYHESKENINKSIINEISEDSIKNEDLIENENLIEFNKNETILIEQKKLHFFSNNDEKDEFYICIKGETIYTGMFFFQITSYEGKLILDEKFPAYLLMDYGFGGDSNSNKDMEEYIVERVTNFFNEENFTYPAIGLEEDFDEEFSDKEIWEDIQSDQTSIGFYYLIGEEDGRHIAFSKKKGKVVMYYNCC